MTLEFLLTSLVVVLLPGTGVIYTLAIGLGRGFKASIAAAFGCTLGIVPAAVASIIGLAALLHTSALAFQAIKFLGVAYLFYMAWKILKDDAVMEVSNVLNPKLSLFFLAFLPQFVSPTSTNATASLVSLAAVFMVMTFAVFVLYGAFASYARDFVIQRPSVMKWIKRCFAGTFGFLGAKLAFTD
ncbi:MAG: lysine transporter LysE [Alphaproteobacteria bacterium]|nr:MAG: lysine transporter LysE [Alphaproteobacteria bacterium]